jgi:hypothetical protein
MLETLLREFNPMHDFDSIRYENPLNERTDTERLRVACMNALYVIGIVKPLIRGAVVGGTLGLVLGREPDYMGVAAVAGSSIDFFQYAIRNCYHLRKTRQ